VFLFISTIKAHRDVFHQIILPVLYSFYVPMDIINASSIQWDCNVRIQSWVAVAEGSQSSWHLMLVYRLESVITLSFWGWWY